MHTLYTVTFLGLVVVTHGIIVADLIGFAEQHTFRIPAFVKGVFFSVIFCLTIRSSLVLVIEAIAALNRLVNNGG